MVFGHGDVWAALLYGTVLLWILLGPPVMAVLGACCARPPGRPRTIGRVGSLLVPLLTVGAPAALLLDVFTPSGAPPTEQDVVSFFGVHVLLLTVVPWLLSWGTARLVEARRRRRRT